MPVPRPMSQLPNLAYPPLLDVLSLTSTGTDAFAAPTPPSTSSRLFGGQLVAQALRAACLTVPDGYLPYQLHAQFLRPGQPHTSLTLHVSRLHDGRAFITRQVTAKQDDACVLALLASFHIGEPGESWQPRHEVGPSPETLPRWPSALDALPAACQFDLRPTCPPGSDGTPTLHPLWFRTRARLPDDPLVHTCVQAFASDFGLAKSARMRYAEPERFTSSSLDHSVWFHRPARADDWLLLSTELMSAASSRHLVHGSLHTSDGALVATVAQTALVRTRTHGPSPLRRPSLAVPEREG